MEGSTSLVKIDTSQKCDTLKLSQIAKNVHKIPLSEKPSFVTSVVYTDEYLFLNGDRNKLYQYDKAGNLIQILKIVGYLDTFSINEAGRQIYVFSRNIKNETDSLLLYNFKNQRQGAYQMQYSPVASLFYNNNLYLLSYEFIDEPRRVKYYLSTFDFSTHKEHFLPFTFIDNAIKNGIAASSHANFFIRNGILYFNIARSKQIFQIIENKVSEALSWEFTNIKSGYQENPYNFLSPCTNIGNCITISYSLKDSSPHPIIKSFVYIMNLDGKAFIVEDGLDGYLFDDITGHRYVSPKQLIGKNEIGYLQDDKTFCIVKLKEYF
jgi:hypothetical protein